MAASKSKTRGRPPLPPDKKRKRFAVRLAPVARAQIEKAAALDKLDPSVWVRWVLETVSDARLKGVMIQEAFRDALAAKKEK